MGMRNQAVRRYICRIFTDALQTYAHRIFHVAFWAAKPNDKRTNHRVTTPC